MGRCHVGERFVGSLPDAVSTDAEARGNEVGLFIADFATYLLGCAWFEDALAQYPHRLVLYAYRRKEKGLRVKGIPLQGLSKALCIVTREMMFVCSARGPVRPETRCYRGRER
jgi:hypothetical protein